MYWETDDPQRTLREIADSQDEFDKKFKQVVENAAPALDLFQENPPIQRTAFRVATTLSFLGDVF